MNADATVGDVPYDIPVRQSPTIHRGSEPMLTEISVTAAATIVRIFAQIMVKRLPIESADVWAEEILKKYKRQDVSDYIVRSGFDAKASAQKMFELYSKLHNEASR